MNKQEALKILKDKLFYNEETSLEVRVDGIEFIKRGIVDDLVLEALEVLEKEERKVIDILNWKDGDIYKWSGMQYKIEQGVLYVSNSGEYWETSTYNNLNDDGKMAKIIKKEAIKKERSVYGILGWEEGDVYKWKDMKYKLENGILYVSDLDEERWTESTYNDLFSYKRMVFIIKDEAVKEKEKAYFVKNQYSFNKLMEELEEQGYMWRDGGKLTEEVELCFCNYIFINSGKVITKDPFLWGICNFEKEYGDRYKLIEYHKEEHLYYAKIKGWELTNDGDCYWYKDKTPIHGIYPWSREEASIYTKEEWAKLGITDENADFEEMKGN